MKRLIPLACCLTVLVGCTPAGQPTTTPVRPSVVPTVPTCEPLDGASPFPCTQAEFDALEEQRALFDEAEAVLRRYTAELSRQEADWQLREMTPEFEATTTGEYRGFVEQFIEIDRRDQAKRITPPAEYAWIRLAPGVAREGSVIALIGCMDARAEQYVTKDSAQPSSGGVVQRTMYFVRSEADLKIASSDVLEVSSC